MCQFANDVTNAFLNYMEGPAFHCSVIWQTQKTKHFDCFAAPTSIAHHAQNIHDVDSMFRGPIVIVIALFMYCSRC